MTTPSEVPAHFSAFGRFGRRAAPTPSKLLRFAVEKGKLCKFGTALSLPPTVYAKVGKTTFIIPEIQVNAEDADETSTKVQKKRRRTHVDRVAR